MVSTVLASRFLVATPAVNNALIRANLNPYSATSAPHSMKKIFLLFKSLVIFCCGFDKQINVTIRHILFVRRLKVYVKMLKTCICCLTKGGSLCCGIFSFIGAVFLALLGILLTYQYEYIHIHEAHETHELATANAYSAAIIYAIIMCICIVSYFKHARQEALERRISQQGLELEDISVPLVPSEHGAVQTNDLYRRQAKVAAT